MVADAEDIAYVWGSLSMETLDKINDPGFVTKDKEQLEHLEEKQRLKEKKLIAKAEARKNRPNIAKLQ